MSFPFIDRPLSVTQPDGMSITVRGTGDQHYAHFVSTDGFPVVRDPRTRFFCYAEPSPNGRTHISTGIPVQVSKPNSLLLIPGAQLAPGARRALAAGVARRLTRPRRWEERRHAARQAPSPLLGPRLLPPSRTTTGTYVGLCLLVDFPDAPGTIDRDEVDRFCNATGYTGYGNAGSVRDYFLDVSRQRLDYSNLVTHYIRMPQSKGYYTDPNVEQPTRAYELVGTALEALRDDGFDFSRLTADEGGYVYAINVFYAGACTNNWGEGLWPHSYRLYPSEALAPGRLAADYQLTDMGAALTLATFCHENGHMICDFPDLYDYGYESAGVGDYCLMCGGGPDPRNPVQVSAYLKLKAGWASSVTPLVPGQDLSAPVQDNVFYLHARNEHEYFLIENRQQAGRDRYLPSAGLAIWHIDELGSNDREQMTSSSHYECALEQADGNYDLERRVNQGDRSDLFAAPLHRRFAHDTTPSSRWWDGTGSELELVDVGECGPTIAFRVAQRAEVSRLSATSTPNQAIPDALEVGIVDALEFAEGGVLAAIRIDVDIEHTFRGDLRVTLEAPSGTVVVLHDRAGGGANHLVQTFDATSTPKLKALSGEPVGGRWRLRVQDLAQLDTGRLKRWALELDVRPVAPPSGVVVLEEAPGVRVPDANQQGIVRSLVCDAEGPLGAVVVELDITHRFVGDLVVTLVSPAGAEVDLHHRQGGSSDNLLGTYDEGSTPQLAGLRGEPMAGVWSLRVADCARLDVGKLNGWRVRLVPAP